MNNTFITFKPQCQEIQKYVDYYYLGSRPCNELRIYDCFAHYNTTISLYQSHKRLEDNSGVEYQDNGEFLQLYTPIRQDTLRVTQKGAVYRIVIVFHPLGVNHFFADLDHMTTCTIVDLFSKEELLELFQSGDPFVLSAMLDGFLQNRFKEFENKLLIQAVQSIVEDYLEIHINDLASSLEISRQYLNRLFTQHLGLSAKKFQQLVRFRKSFQTKMFSQEKIDWSTAAYENGFSCPSHLNKLYKSITGYTPCSFLSKGTLIGQEDTFWHEKKITKGS